MKTSRIHPDHNVEARARVTRRVVGVVALILSLAAIVGRAAFADAPYPTYNANPPSANERPTFWLVDENGAWRAPLPNWTLEEIMRFVDSKNEPTSAAPYSIQEVSAIGAMEDGVARIAVTLVVNVAEGYVRAPIGLREGVGVSFDGDNPQDALFSYEGPGACALEIDPQTGDYAAVFYTLPDAERGARKSAEKPTRAPVDSRYAEKQADEEGEKNENKDVADSPETSPEPSSEDAPQASSEARQDSDATQEESQEATPEETPDEARDEAAAETSDPAPETDPEATDSNDDAASRPTNPRERDSVSLRPFQYALRLNLCFAVEESLPVDGSGADEDRVEYRLVASFPPSLHSQLTLRTPISDVEIVSVRGAAADAPKTMDETTSELSLRGLGRSGESVELAWRKDLSKKPGNSAESVAALQVEDAVVNVELNALDTTYVATLPIRVFGGELDVFRVLLPPEAEVTPDAVSAIGANGVAVEVVGVSIVSEPDAPGAANDRFLETRLAQKTSFATLTITARTPITNDLDDGVLAKRQITGFGVVGARKQHGRVRVVKSQDAPFTVSPVFGASSALDATPDDKDGEETFVFFSQPFKLAAESYKRETIVNVKPEYQLFVGDAGLRLRARFLFSIYGSKIRELKINFNGWSLVEINESASAPTRPLRKEDDATVFPLATPTDGEAVFEVELARDLDAPLEVDAPPTRVLLPTPIPVADRVEPAALVVVSENDVETVPAKDEIVGLAEKSARAFALNLEIPKDARQTPLYYQTRALTRDPSNDDKPKVAAPVLALDLQRRRQEINVVVKTDATLNEKGETKVVQTFEYQIEREPLEYFSFKALVDAAKESERPVKCFVDGKARLIELVPKREPVDDLEEFRSDDDQIVKSNEYAYYRVNLDAPKIGSCVVTLQYELKDYPIEPGQTTHVKIFLYQPTRNVDDLDDGDALVGNSLTFTTPTGVSARYATATNDAASNDESGMASFWRIDKKTTSDDGRTETVACSSVASEYEAKFKIEKETETDVAVVDRAWIQSWLNNSMRVDRAAFRVSCKQEVLNVKLPDQALADRVSVSLNGAPLAAGSDLSRGFALKGRVVQIPIPEELRANRFTLDLSYVVPQGVGKRGRCEAQLPAFDQTRVWVRRAYWQLVMNGDRLVVVDPKTWTPEYFVQRRGFFGYYRRVSTVTQEELADWVGVPAREPTPQEANSYLYSSFGGAELDLISDDALDSPSGDALDPFDRSQTIVFYVADRALVVLFCSGFALVLGLSLLRFPALRGGRTLFCIVVLALGLAAIRPPLALLFMQTAALGAALTFLAFALSKYMSKRAERPAISATIAAAEQKKRPNEQGATLD